MGEYHFPLLDRREIAEDTMAFWFDTKGSAYRFEAGQNNDMTLENPPETDAEGNTRTFSVASAPQEHDRIMIATRLRPTAFKKSLQSMPLGTPVLVRGPMGNMTLHEDVSRPAVFLAGGIGITPFRSMLADAVARNLPHHITLLYTNRSRAATAFLDDMIAWAEHPNINIVLTVSDEAATPPFHSGLITSDRIRKSVDDFEKAVYYLAGPPGFVGGMKELLGQLAVSKDSIRLEEFTGY